MTSKKSNRYESLIADVFHSRFKKGTDVVSFERVDIERSAHKKDVILPKNLGDLIYSFRFRAKLPPSVIECAPRGMEWIIRLDGRSKNKFVARKFVRIIPTANLAETKVPDATPGVIAMYAFTDEQALLAKIRYNRLIDMFTRIICYSLQNHMRTTVRHIGQVEADEVYIGIDRRGAHYVFPVQAKGGKESMSVVQIEQDIAMCAEKFPSLICRAIGTQFMRDETVAMFEFEQVGDDIKIAAEKHYRLVPSDQVTPEDLATYANRAIDG